MFRTKALDSFNVRGHQLICVESPVSAERTNGAMLAALGPAIEIDGTVYKPLGVELIAGDKRIYHGEAIGIFVERAE